MIFFQFPSEKKRNSGRDVCVCTRYFTDGSLNINIALVAIAADGIYDWDWFLFVTYTHDAHTIMNMRFAYEYVHFV